MKKILVFLLLLSGLLLSGCSQETEEVTIVPYQLDTIDFEVFDEENYNSVLTSSIGLGSSVEIQVDFEFSYSSVRYSMWGQSTQTVTKTASSQATGFFINEEGYLLTNAHVVTLADYESYPDFAYKNISVSLNYADSEQYFPAEIIAYEQDLDLAVLKAENIDLTKIQYLTFFNITDPSDSAYGTDESISLYYGEPVFAVGNAFGLGLSISSGVVSAPLRYVGSGEDLMKVIQTDTAINYGNSGGPLLNAYGDVIGIISFKLVGEEIDNLGYAIPTYTILEYLTSLNSSVGFEITDSRSY